jgi:hypothetical protein
VDAVAAKEATMKKMTTDAAATKKATDDATTGVATEGSAAKVAGVEKVTKETIAQ